MPCLKNGGIRCTIIGNEYYFEPSCSAAHHLQQRLKPKLGDVRSAVDDDFIQLAISRTVILLSQQSGEAPCFSWTCCMSLILHLMSTFKSKSKLAIRKDDDPWPGYLLSYESKNRNTETHNLAMSRCSATSRKNSNEEEILQVLGKLLHSVFHSSILPFSLSFLWLTEKWLLPGCTEEADAAAEKRRNHKKEICWLTD